MYVNGGVGTAQYGDEGFGEPYLLPNRTYCESCAAIAGVLWQHRMNLLMGEAKYVDVMELVLYNGMLSGIGIAGDGFFYQNPLESNGATRRTWIGQAKSRAILCVDESPERRDDRLDQSVAVNREASHAHRSPQSECVPTNCALCVRSAASRK